MYTCYNYFKNLKLALFESLLETLNLPTKIYQQMKIYQ